MMNTLFKYGCRHDYQQFQYLCQCHPHLATGGNGGLPTAPVAPPRKRKVHTTSSGTDLAGLIRLIRDIATGIFLLAFTCFFGLLMPFTLAGMDQPNHISALYASEVPVAIKVLVASAAVMGVTDACCAGRQAFQTQLSNTASPQVDAIVTALQQVYPRYCVVDWPVFAENDKNGTAQQLEFDNYCWEAPAYCVYMTADAPVPRRGQQITTGSQYLVIRNKYYGVTGYSIATLAISDHDEVTLVTTGTCAPVEPLRCFAQRVVSGAASAAGAGINNID